MGEREAEQASLSPQSQAKFLAAVRLAERLQQAPACVAGGEHDIADLDLFLEGAHADNAAAAVDEIDNPGIPFKAHTGPFGRCGETAREGARIEGRGSGVG